MAGHRTIVGGVVAAAACAALAGPAAKANTVVNERLILDGCEVGGGGNDIHSVQSHYEPERDRIVVTLRLCGPARPEGHLSRAPRPHRAIRRQEPRYLATAPRPRTAWSRARRAGISGVGTSEVQGDLVRFVVPLARLHVGTPKDVPLIPLWATSTLGKVEDRAPNRETGDGCAHPQATTETLVQARVAITGVAFILSYSFTGAIASTPGQAIALADVLCQGDAKSAGFTDTDDIHAWLSNEASTPASYVNPFFGPIQTADGTQVAQSTSAFACSPSGNWPAGTDRQGHPRQPGPPKSRGRPPCLDRHGTRPATTGAVRLSNCQDWTSNSASDIGTGGNMTETDAGFTTGFLDNCDQSHHVMCVQFE